LGSSTEEIGGVEGDLSEVREPRRTRGCTGEPREIGKEAGSQSPSNLNSRFKTLGSYMWKFMPVIPALGRLR
jgi:hypothetical protein